MLVDSHCHINFRQLRDQKEAVLARAQAAGVTHMLVVGVDRPSAADLLRFVEELDPRFFRCSVGVHPCSVAGTESLEAFLEQQAQNPLVVGLGETGLDFYRTPYKAEAQEDSFRLHIRAARAFDLPVIIHTRQAFAQTRRLVEAEMAEKPFDGLIHCFSGDRDFALWAQDMGLYVSFSGVLTYKNADIEAAAQVLRADRLLVETDSPFLVPRRAKGPVCEPAFVRFTAQKLADLRDVSLETIARQTTENFFRLFRKFPAPF